MKPYYEESGIVIYHGDCLKVLPTLECCDAVVTDPPYSEYVHAHAVSGNTKGGTVRAIMRDVDFGFEHLDDETRIFVGNEIARLAQRWVLIFSDIENAHRWREVTLPLEYIRTGIWIKKFCTPQFTGDRPAIGAEAVPIFHKAGRKRWNGGGKPAVWEHEVVLRRQSDPRLHTTQKPLPLMSQLVSLFTDPGELILDPFMGSGTTLVACKNLGRRAIGIEISEDYCRVAVERLRQSILPLGAQA